MFRSCVDCVAPQRHPGCHSTCEEYLKSKELWERRNEKIKKEKDRQSMFIEHRFNNKR